MDTAYAQTYENLWNRHWWWQARKRFVGGHVARLARERQLHDILDIGCGNGLFFDVLSRYGTVRGIEPDASLVSDHGKWRSHIEVRPFTADYPTDRPLDLILMLDVLEHIADDAAAVRHVHALLKPGGYYLLTVPAMMWLWSMHDVVNQHHRRYTKRTLRTVLEAAGFRILRLQYFFGWTVAPMLLRRVLKPGKGKPEDYRVEVPPGPINGTMYTLSVTEQAIMGSLGTPVGSSVLAIAQKPE